jgi:serine protease AprX
LRQPNFDVTVVPASPDEVVHFTIVARPASGIGLDELREKLRVKTFEECLPEKSTLLTIADRLETLGFEVFRDAMTLHVSARGTVARFEQVFQTQLVKNIQHVTIEADAAQPKTYTQEWFAIGDDAPEPSLAAIPGALAIALPPAPRFLTPRLPPIFPGPLRVPGDIAQLLNASATHRQQVNGAGDRATGVGITVAVIDSGFARHPYYEEHKYDIQRFASDDASDPYVDLQQHGTAIIANLFACAPDVSAIAVKKGLLPELAFEKARSFNPYVISFSVGYDLGNVTAIPADYVPLAMQVVQSVVDNIVVVAAAGNFGLRAFPAMMPECLAVGGVDIDAADQLSVSSTSSSFVHPIYPSRKVPDVCAFATGIVLPIADPSGIPGWATLGFTSCATPQVAGVCALLLQNNPSLTPQVVRSVLYETAVDISAGTSATGMAAIHGKDRATGGGLVDAFAAWKGVRNK